MEASNKEGHHSEPRRRFFPNRLFDRAVCDATKDRRLSTKEKNNQETEETDCENSILSGNVKKELNNKDKPDCTKVLSSPPLNAKCEKNSPKVYQNFETNFHGGNVEKHFYHKDSGKRLLQNQHHSQFQEHRNYSQDHKTYQTNHSKNDFRFDKRRSFNSEEDYRDYKTKSNDDDRWKQHKQRNSFNGDHHWRSEKWKSCDTRNKGELDNYRVKGFCLKKEFEKSVDAPITKNFSSCDKESGAESKNHYWERKDHRDQNFVKVSEKPASDDETESIENYCEFSEIKHERKFSNIDEGFKISYQNDRLTLSSVIDLNKSSNLEVPKDDEKNLQNECTVTEEKINIQNIFLPDKENYIPPPIPPEDMASSSICESSIKDINRNRQCLNYRSSDSANETLSINESETDCSSLLELDSEHLDAITKYIKGIVQEKSVSNSLADKVVADLNRIFKYHLEGNKIDAYGSYSCDLAISTSDLNLVMKADSTVRKSFMYEIYKLLSRELKKYTVHPYEEGSSATQTKILFTEPDFGICCQLVYLGRRQSRIFDMGKFLKRVCAYDPRVKILIIAAKIWAEICLINEFEEGKLHPLGFTLMMVHFLQQYESPILPVFSDQDDEVESSHSLHDACIGELWVAFLKYYALKFDWKYNVVTVNSKESVSKKSKGWETYWIAIEDPFSGKNIASSVVNSDVADSIKACFKASYEYFSTPPESGITFDSADEDSFNNGSTNGKWQYSFQMCTVDNSDAFCDACDELDDICEECKKKIYVPPIPALPEVTDNFFKQIKSALNAVFEKYMLTDDEVYERKSFVSNLQKEVQKIYSDAELKLFGSSTNGFGFKNSDLDICMAFKEQEKLNLPAVLRTLRTLLQKNKGFDHVYVISKAQIPIIKFHYEPKRWRGDISINNVLAVHNSELLHTYSIIDQRCKILGCALKLLAKKALIAEVTDKALSSYSYLLMVIHFLQQTDPPVLPVLQDSSLRKDTYRLSDIVDNWNVWFCKDLKYVEKVYIGKYGTRNETPVEKLWLDLLDFYCSYESNRIITIRQRESMFLKENQHSARLFNIQDPFIENKNLGSVVSGKKAQESQNVLRRARYLFRTSPNESGSSVKNAEDYFFSTMSLTGKIQKEAECNMCGKFDHEDKDCKHSHFLKRNFFRKFPPRNRYNWHRKQMNRDKFK